MCGLSTLWLYLTEVAGIDTSWYSKMLSISQLYSKHKNDNSHCGKPGPVWILTVCEYTVYHRFGLHVFWPGSGNRAN